MVLKNKKSTKTQLKKDAEELYQEILALSNNSILPAEMTYNLVTDNLKYGQKLIDQLRDSKKIVYRNTDDVFIII